MALPLTSRVTLGKALSLPGLSFSTTEALCVAVKVMDFGSGLLSLNSMTNITLGK